MGCQEVIISCEIKDVFKPSRRIRSRSDVRNSAKTNARTFQGESAAHTTLMCLRERVRLWGRQRQREHADFSHGRRDRVLMLHRLGFGRRSRTCMSGKCGLNVPGWLFLDAKDAAGQ